MKPLKQGDRIPFVYLEHGTLKTDKSQVILEQSKGKQEIPIHRLACLLLGPGTSATHAAIKNCADSGCLVQWVGDNGTRIYAAGDPLAGDPERIRKQAIIATNLASKAKVARWMFARRFNAKPPRDVDIPSLRGMEGARVKAIYQKLAAQHKLQWHGRIATFPADKLNEMISMANGHLMQTATIAVLIAGFNPAIGFLHEGFNRAFACDIADLYKFDLSVPLAFDLYTHGVSNPQQEIRRAMRDLISKEALIDKMIKDSIEAINAGLRSS